MKRIPAPGLPARPLGPLSRRGALLALASAVSSPVVAACAPSGARPSPTAPKTSPAPARRRRLPRTRAIATRPESLETQRSPFPITSVGLKWRGPRTGLRIRFLDGAGTPSEWIPVEAGCPCGRDSSSGVRGAEISTAVVRADDARGYQLAYPGGIDLLGAVVIDTVHGPERLVASPAPKPSAGSSGGAPPTLDDLGLVSRAEWGADEAKATAVPVFSPVQALTVHHTVTADDDPDPAATVRAIFELHAVQNGWGDIGYHFLVDASGRVYEGRASGADGQPAHNAAGEGVTAFHTAGFNTGNIGIALLGNMMERPPSPAAQRSTARLLAALARKHGLDPLSEITYVNPATGATRKTSPVNGHGTWTSTECPGTETGIAGLRKAASEELAV
ncbi:N-acetylmuramoyl-L-alanine amidase [Streptomyces sp. NPDC050804]|uniref:N-acetylmuramoyl-L-alanine amidase n=1 Tax=Streptomyces sp. NPDC050804 TaxID=3154745 RepID=UPI003414EC74